MTDSAKGPDHGGDEVMPEESLQCLYLIPRIFGSQIDLRAIFTILETRSQPENPQVMTALRQADVRADVARKLHVTPAAMDEAVRNMDSDAARFQASMRNEDNAETLRAVIARYGDRVQLGNLKLDPADEGERKLALFLATHLVLKPPFVIENRTESLMRKLQRMIFRQLTKMKR